MQVRIYNYVYTKKFFIYYYCRNASYKVLRNKGIPKIPNLYSASAHQGVTEVYKARNQKNQRRTIQIPFDEFPRTHLADLRGYCCRGFFVSMTRQQRQQVWTRHQEIWKYEAYAPCKIVQSEILMSKDPARRRSVLSEIYSVKTGSTQPKQEIQSYQDTPYQAEIHSDTKSINHTLSK